MRIGYAVEGSTDRAVVRGLCDRWCRGAELAEGHFRGSTALSRRREIPKICEEFAIKGVDVMVFVTDANDRPWREVLGEERARIPPPRLALSIVAVPERNIECWICCNADYVATRLGVSAAEFRVPDPKDNFQTAMRIARDDRREAEIAELVREAPLQYWLASPSFSDFYEQVRDMSQQIGCEIENLRESRTARDN